MARSYGPIAARSGRDGLSTAQSGLEHALLESLGAPRTPEDSRLPCSDRLSEGTGTVVDAVDRREAAECGVGSEPDWQRLGWQPRCQARAEVQG